MRCHAAGKSTPVPRPPVPAVAGSLRNKNKRLHPGLQRSAGALLRHFPWCPVFLLCRHFVFFPIRNPPLTPLPLRSATVLKCLRSPVISLPPYGSVPASLPVLPACTILNVCRRSAGPYFPGNTPVPQCPVPLLPGASVSRNRPQTSG